MLLGPPGRPPRAKTLVCRVQTERSPFASLVKGGFLAEPHRTGLSGFKYSIWLRCRATSHMAFGVAAQLVCGACSVGLGGIWRFPEEGA